MWLCVKGRLPASWGETSVQIFISLSEMLLKTLERKEKEHFKNGWWKFFSFNAYWANLNQDEGKAGGLHMHPKYITSPTLLSKQNEKLPTWGWKPKHRLTDVSLWHSKASRWFLHSLRVHLWWRERQEDNTREQRFSLSSDRRMDRLIMTGKSLGPTAPIKQQRAKNTLKRKKITWNIKAGALG